MFDTITYKLDLFEGPLDLLLSLISKNKININDIPISLLCDQYMEYIRAAEKLNLELSSEFIVMASELMLIKSRMLLPRDEKTEEDPRAALAAAVLEYKRAKEAAVQMAELYSFYGSRFAKDTDEIMPDKSYVAEHDIRLLEAAYRRVISEVKITDKEAVKRFEPLIKKESVSAASAAAQLVSMITASGGLPLLSCFAGVADKDEAIARFCALLEILKTGLFVLDEEAYSGDGVLDVLSGVGIKVADGADLSGDILADITSE